MSGKSMSRRSVNVSMHEKPKQLYFYVIAEEPPELRCKGPARFESSDAIDKLP
jgi:hypothetical protein